MFYRAAIGAVFSPATFFGAGWGWGGRLFLEIVMSLERTLKWMIMTGDIFEPGNKKKPEESCNLHVEVINAS